MTNSFLSPDEAVRSEEKYVVNPGKTELLIAQHASLTEVMVLPGWIGPNSP